MAQGQTALDWVLSDEPVSAAPKQTALDWVLSPDEPSPADRFAIPDIGEQAKTSGIQAPENPVRQGFDPATMMPRPDPINAGIEDVLRGAEQGGGRMLQVGGKLARSGLNALQEAFGGEATEAEKKRQIQRAQKPGLALQAQAATHPAPDTLPGKIMEGIGSAVPILGAGAVNPALGAGALGMAGAASIDETYQRTKQETGSDLKATERALAEVPLQALYLMPLGRILMGAGEGATIARKALDGAISGALGPGAARVVGEVVSERINQEDKANLGEALKRGLAGAGQESMVNVPVFAFLSAVAGIGQTPPDKLLADAEKATGGPEKAGPEAPGVIPSEPIQPGEAPPPELAPNVTLGAPAKEPLTPPQTAAAPAETPSPEQPPAAQPVEATPTEPAAAPAETGFPWEARAKETSHEATGGLRPLTRAEERDPLSRKDVRDTVLGLANQAQTMELPGQGRVAGGGAEGFAQKGRTQGANAAEWWGRRPEGNKLSPKEIQAAAQKVWTNPKAKLGPAQQEIIDFLTSEAVREIPTREQAKEAKASLLTRKAQQLAEAEPGSRGAVDLFGPRNPTQAAPEGAFDAADETRRDRLYSGLVNDLERIVQLEKAAPEKIAGEPLEQSLSLMPGRRYGESEKLRANTIDPLKAMLSEAKIPPIESKGGVPSASDYLYAVHTLEAPESADTGMSAPDAAKIRVQAESGLNAKAYQKIRDWNRALNVKRLDVMEKGGLISAETRKAWVDKYGPDYVPTRTAQDPFDRYVGQGKGLGVRGRESKAREGRSSKADSPLVFALETMDTANERAESNRIGQKLGELVEKNPDGPWKVETDQNKRRQGEEWLPYKVNGEQRFVVTEDKGLAEAFKRLQNPDPGVLKVLDPLLRFWHKVIIQYNPVFPLTNVPRDMGVASIRHAIHGDLSAVLGTLKNGLPAARGAFEAIRTEGAGGKWGGVYRKARDAGALIGWKNQLDYSERVKDFEKAVGRTSKAAAFGQLIDDINSSTELGTRLATFDSLLKSGKSESESAMATRRITADFARRGRWAPVYRRLYLFSGANVQGTSEMLSSIRKNPGKAATVIGALIGSGYLNYALSKTYGDETELDKLSESDKARFIGVMLGKRRYGFAAPYGFNLFPYLGWKLGEATLGGKDPKKMLGGLASTTIDSFSPLPQGSSVMQSLTPTVARPFEEIAENRKFSGAPIEPDQSPFERVKKPHSQRFFPNVSGASKEVAEALNRVTGGNQLEPGMVDISPEWIDHLTAAMTGGLGTFSSRTFNVAKSVIDGNTSDLRLTDIPVVRPFVQEASRGAGTRLYHENLTDMELAKKQAKAGMAVKDGGLLHLDQLARDTDKRVTAIYKLMDAASEKDKPRYQEAIDALHDRFNQAAKAARTPR